LDFSFPSYLLLALGPPIIGLATAFAIGIVWDRAELFNYRWECGVGCRLDVVLIFSLDFQMVTLLPSISRVINLSKERLVWNVAVLLHSSLRPLVLTHHCELDCLCTL